MKTILRVFSIIICSFLIACSTTTTTTKTPISKTLRLASKRTPTSFDPRRNNDSVTIVYVSMFSSGFFEEKGANNYYEPAALSRFEMSEDNKSCTFYLKSNLKWSDGHEITADDFINSWKSTLTPGFTSEDVNELYFIKNAEKIASGELPTAALGVKKIGDKNKIIHVEFDRPVFNVQARFCLTVTHPIPSHIIDNPITWGTDFDDFKVVSGSHMPHHFSYNNNIRMKKNPYYWNADAVTSEFVDITIVKDDNTINNLYNKDKIDFIGKPFGCPLHEIVSEKKHSDIRFKPINSAHNWLFNTTTTPFNNTKIRKALSYSLNRSKMTSQFLSGHFEPSTSIVSKPASVNQHPLFIDNQADLSRKLFEEGLEELGINRSNLKPIRILINSGTQVNKNTAQLIAEQWKNVLNIDVFIDEVEFQTYLYKIKNKQYDIARFSWMTETGCPEDFIKRYTQTNDEDPSIWNCTGWKNERYTQIYNEAKQKTNEIEYYKLLANAETLLLEEMPVMPMFTEIYNYLKKPDIKGLYIDKGGYVKLNYCGHTKKG